MTILGKKQMSEEDIKLNYITPVILSGWKGHITMETKITDGRINISGNIVARSKPKFADYMLYLNDGKPIVWGVAGYADQKGFAGFLVASDFDKEKFVHFVSFDEWQKVIDAAIKNGAF